MPRPVSIIVWRDARDDPPMFPRRYLVKHEKFEEDSFTTAYWNLEYRAWDRGYYDGVRGVTHWAELPVLSDLTDEDVRNVALWALDGEVLATGTHNAADRLRAALGGEKEEA